MNLNGKNILIVGLGRTGTSLARFLVKRGAFVTVTDASPAKNLQASLERLDGLDVRKILGGHDPCTFFSADLIVLSPGVPHTLEVLSAAREKNIPVIGEIELASKFMHTPILAVTGTNGKSTATLLLGEMLKASGFSVFVGGNLGTPLIEYVDNGEGSDFAVAEISSFQLDTINDFKPKVSVLLNITDDHLDRYDDFEAYVRSKARVFENQGAADFAVLNGSDAAVMSAARHICAKKFVFNCEDAMPNGAQISDRAIRFFIDGAAQVLDCKNIRIPGRHNLENVAAAGLAALAAGSTLEQIGAAVEGFAGLPHRIAHVAQINGVDYYDDSKATNVDAVKRALEMFSVPVVLIMGGRDKGGSYDALIPEIRRCVSRLIVMGEAADKIMAALGKQTPASVVSSMKEAVALAHQNARPGAAVLLSPACSSFDRYESYAQRGDDFAARVLSLKGDFS